ncbi:MAG: hypothetical protein RLO18_18970, partial [Gimesia chilikensis]
PVPSRLRCSPSVSLQAGCVWSGPLLILNGGALMSGFFFQNFGNLAESTGRADARKKRRFRRLRLQQSEPKSPSALDLHDQRFANLLRRHKHA